MTASILSNNRVHAPFGAQGGAVGALGANYVERVDGSREALAHIGRTQMQPGDIFVVETPGEVASAGSERLITPESAAPMGIH